MDQLFTKSTNSSSIYSKRFCFRGRILICAFAFLFFLFCCFVVVVVPVYVFLSRMLIFFFSFPKMMTHPATQVFLWHLWCSDFMFMYCVGGGDVSICVCVTDGGLKQRLFINNWQKKINFSSKPGPFSSSSFVVLASAQAVIAGVHLFLLVDWLSYWIIRSFKS